MKRKCIYIFFYAVCGFKKNWFSNVPSNEKIFETFCTTLPRALHCVVRPMRKTNASARRDLVAGAALPVISSPGWKTRGQAKRVESSSFHFTVRQHPRQSRFVGRSFGRFALQAVTGFARLRASSLLLRIKLNFYLQIF